MAKKQPKYLVIEKLSKELPTELDAAEREALKDRENQLGEAVLVLEREHESIRAGEKEEARTRREAIKDARAAWSKTIDERRSGTAMREYKCELRAVIASQTIDLVRVTDGEVIETRAMSEEERAKYLQPSLDIAPALPLTTTDDALADEPEATAGDTLPDDECDAIRVPHGWPRAWLDRIWRVDDAALPLSGGDVAQVYHSLASSGSTLDELCAEGAPAAYLGRAHVALALARLNGRELVVKDDDGKWWAKVEAPAPTEPGRNDSLPEAADASKKPKRTRARDTGEQAINAALGQSEGHVHH